MVVVERAYEVIVTDLILLVVIGTCEDILHGVLILHDEVVGILRLEAIAQSGNLVDAVDHSLPCVAALSIHGDADALALSADLLTQRLTHGVLAGLVGTHEVLIAGLGGIIDGINGCVERTLSHAHIGHCLGYTTIVFTTLLTRLVRQMRNTIGEFTRHKLEDFGAVRLCHIGGAHRR